MKPIRILLGVLLGALLCTLNLRADDVTDAVAEAMESYKAGDYEAAAGMLEYAAGIIRQMRGGNLESLLPQAPDGWESEGPSSEAIGAAMFGGGTSASQHYTKGEKSVSITYLGDSPMLQTMGMMFNNPALAANAGMRFKRVKGEKILVEFEEGDDSGKAMAFVANKWLVTIEVNGMTADELLEWAGLVDYAALAQF